MTGFLLFVLAVVALNWVLDYLQRARYRELEHAHQVHWVTTTDQVRIALWRMLPKSGQPKGQPVILVHGLGSNHRNMDINDTNGVAQYLSKRGYDCWSVDLRGRLGSENGSSGWNFDDYARFDLPAAIKYILETTGYAQLHWVGHSMGGMLYYAVAGSGGCQDQIASAVTLGSPVRFFKPSPAIKFVLNYQKVLTLFKRIPVPLIIRFSILGLKLVPKQLLYYQINPANIEPKTLRIAASNAVSWISPQVLVQFANWIVEHRWTSVDGAINYRAEIPNIKTPTLVIYGALDRLCPGYTVKHAYDLLDGKQHAWIEAGEDSGMMYDYGHVDLIFGRNAPQEIFTRIEDWLTRHSVDELASI